MEANIAQIPQRWVNPIRAFIILAIISHFYLFALGVPVRFEQMSTVCTTEACPIAQPTQEDIEVLEEAGLSLAFSATFNMAQSIFVAVIMLPLIAVLLWRASTVWMGIIASLTMLYIGTSLADVVFALGDVRPELYPLLALNLAVGGTCYALTLFTFPDGRFYPRWTRIVVPVIIVMWLSGYVATGAFREYLTTPAPSDAIFLPLAGAGYILVLVLGFATQVIRYRAHYDDLRRQQTRWLIAAAMVTILGSTLWGITNLTALSETVYSGASRAWIGIMFGLIGTVSSVLMPIAVTIAILRYKLWNIDIIIRRTLQYATVTLVLAITYFGGVIILQTLFNSLTGSDSPLAVVASTLLIAALFNPLRNRVQAFVDRRFYRQKYDTQQTLERFGDIARDEVNLAQIEEALVSTIHDTMQPEHVSLWLTSGKD